MKLGVLSSVALCWVAGCASPSVEFIDGPPSAFSCPSSPGRSADRLLSEIVQESTWIGLYDVPTRAYAESSASAERRRPLPRSGFADISERLGFRYQLVNLSLSGALKGRPTKVASFHFVDNSDTSARSVLDDRHDQILRTGIVSSALTFFGPSFEGGCDVYINIADSERYLVVKSETGEFLIEPMNSQFTDLFIGEVIKHIE